MNSAFLMVALLWSAAFALLPLLGLPWVVGLFVALLLGPRFDEPPVAIVRERPRASGMALGLLACAPPFLVLALTWRQEFPLVGDHDFHLGMAEQSYAFWRRLWLPTALATTALFVFARTRVVRWGAPVFLVVLAVLAPYLSTGQTTFAIRYPGTFHFALFPLSVLSRLIGFVNPLDASRLAAALSVPAWLFVLRPLILGLWPSKRVLLFAVLFVYQKDVAYYLSSPYLEPWALVLLLLAVEHLLLFGTAHAWRAMLLVGFAAVIKEQAIFVLPFLAVATWDRRARTLFSYVWAALPFVVYYGIRKSAAVWRTADLASWSEIARSDRVALFAGRVWVQFGPFIVVLLALVAAALVAAIKVPERRKIFLALPLAAAFQVVFFFCDRISLDFTGYARFHLIPQVLLASVVLYPRWGELLSAPLRGALALGATGAQGLTLVPFLSLCAGSDVRRNYFEHTDSPIFLPLRAAIRDASPIPAFDVVKRLKLVGNTRLVLPGYSAAVESRGYPDLSERFELDNRLDEVAPEGCRCEAEDQATVGLFVYFDGLSAQAASRPAAEGWARTCVAHLREGCREVRVLEERGQTISAVGFGRLR